ncbi:GPCR fungal pheromone mating factor [Cyathus striatus]|nr:GPCR fungal pheromone mating factor [Cyathus striatus]
MHAELPVVSFICALLSLAPLPWHWRAGTVPTISLSIWLFFSNLINGINSIIWSGNVEIVAVVWCDIATKILMGANVALASSIFCLCVHLERVSSVRQVRTTPGQRRRRQIIDCLLCGGFPMIYMALHYIVQGHRFDIVEDFGCRPYTYVSWPSVIIIWIPPLLFSVASLIISGMAFRNFWIRRISFARHLQESSSALTPSKYFRLMSMSLVQMFWGLLVISLNMWFTMKHGLRPWTGWNDVHYNFSRVGLFPTIFLPTQDLAFTFALWWAVPISTLLFFGFFAFGQDAMKEYHACFRWVRRTIFRVSDKPSIVKDTFPFPSQ